eukprot:tig00000169_g11887.t1
MSEERSAKRPRPDADASSGSGPLPMDVTVLQHQNKMLAQRLSEYKRDAAELERKNANLTARQLAFDTHMSVVNRYWHMLNENLSVILARISPTPLPSAEPEIKTEDSKTPIPFMQRLLDLDRPIEQEDLEQRLHLRCEFTAATLGQIVDVLERQEKKFQDLFAMFRNETDPAKKGDLIWQAIQHDNQALREAHERNKVVMDTLQVRHHNIMVEIKEQQDTNIFSKQRLAELETDNERLRNDFVTVDRRLAKLQDQIEKQRQTILAAEEEKSKAAQASSSQGQAPSPPPASGSGQAANGPTVEKSELEIAEATAKARLEEIERLREQKVVLEQELQRLKTQAVVASDEAVSKAPKFLALFQHFQIQGTEKEQMRSAVSALTRDLTDLRESSAAELERLTESEREKRELLDGKLREAERELARLRGEREELNLKVLQLQKGAGQGGGIKREDLVLLERNLQSQNRKLIRQVADLKQKLEEKDAQKEAEFSERLGARSVEVKELQEKLARAQERVKQLETGSSSGAGAQASPRGEEGPKTAEELQTALRKREVQLAKAEKGLGEVRAQLEAAKAEQEAVLAELEAVSKEFELLQDQNLRLAKELTEKDDANTQLIAERIKANQQQAAVAAERDALARKVAALEEAHTAQGEQLAKVEARVGTIAEHAARAGEEARTSVALVEALKRAGRDAQKEAADAKTEAEGARQQLADVQRRLDEKIAELEVVDHQRKRASEELAASKRRLEKELERRKERERGGGRDGELEELMQEELRVTKEKLKCSVCHLRPKEVIIARCFHMFCQHCIQKSLQVRNRKCPACGEKYGGESDIHNIYL